MKGRTKSKLQQQKSQVHFGRQEKAQQKLQNQQAKKVLSWAKQICKHPQYYKRQKEDHDNYQYYHIMIQSLRKVQLNLSSRRKAFLQFSAIAYDSSKASFLGQTQLTDIVEVDDHYKAVIQCGKSFYLYTAHEKLSVRICLWRLDCDKNSKGGEFVNKRTFLGEFDAKIGLNGQSGSIVKILSNNENTNLFVDQQTAEDNEKIEISSQGQVVYKVLNTHSLTLLRYFVPSDYICDYNTVVLGLKNSKIQENGEIVIADRSKLRIELRSLILPRIIIKRFFELAQEKVGFSYQVVGLPKSSLKDIILHIEYHNGWKSVCSESLPLTENKNQSLLISKEMIQSKMRTNQGKIKQNVKKSSKITENQTGNKVFTYEKMKQLTAVFIQEGGALLYWLQAKIQVNFEANYITGKSAKAELVYLPVAFSVKPISEMQEEQVSKFELQLGNLFNLSHLSKFLEQLAQDKKAVLLQNQPKIICEVMFYLLKGKGGMEAMTSNIQKQAQQVEQLKVQKQKLARLKRKLKEQKRKKLIELNQEIPFLDPSKLKAELYEEKLQVLQNQRQEKQEELFFLQAKIAQLQRAALKNKLQNQDKENDEYDYGVEVTKQLPDNFQDYKAEETKVDFASQQTIVPDSAIFCKKALKVAALTHNLPFIEQWLSTKTYLNIRLVKLENFVEDLQSYSFGVQNINGSLHYTDPITPLYHQQHYKSINVLLSSHSLESLHRLLESLSNGFLQIFAKCDPSNHLIGIGFVDLGPLFQQLSEKGLHSAQLRSRIQFRLQNTSLCELQAVFSLTQAHLSQQKPVSSPAESEGNRRNPENLSMKSRIERFKEQNLAVNNSQAKKGVIEKAISCIKTQKHEIIYSRNKQSSIKLKLSNSHERPRRFQIVIADEDSSFLQQAELKLQLPSNLHSFTHTQQQIDQQKDAIDLPAGSEIQIIAIYMSKRQLLRDVYKSRVRKDKDMYRRFNHVHTITLRVLQAKTRIVQKVYQLAIIPRIDSFAIVIQKYISEDAKAIVMPIPTGHLAIESDLQAKALPTRIILSLPPTIQPQNDYTISNLRLYRQLGNGKILFEQFQAWLWKCVKLQVQTRLWQQQNILLKIPIQQIVKAELKLGREITSLHIASKHVDFKVRSNNQYSYYSTTNFSKKNNQIYIRGKLHTSAVGRQKYPVVISDQFGNSFYRIAITADIPFPSLAPPQIITLKIPQESRSEVCQFAFLNKTGYDSTFKAKSLRPHLVKIVQNEKGLKKNESWQIELQFNWERIEQELIKEGQSQCSCLLGIMNGFAIQYILFRCKQ